MAVEGNAPVGIAVDQLKVIDCPIAKLADENLAAVFKHLPPYDRLRVSEVCRRWHEISRNAWLDLAEVDLGPVPGRHIAAIVRQCPNLKSAFAFKKSFDLNELACLSRSRNLSTVKLYDCKFAVQSDPSVMNDGFASIFSRDLPHTSWDELVLHDAQLLAQVSLSPFATTSPHRWVLSAEHLPASLTRLQLSGLRMEKSTNYDESSLLDGLSRLQSLECLVLHHTYAPGQTANCDVIWEGLNSEHVPYMLQKLSVLKNLRELAIGPVYEYTRVKDLIASLSKLEVLFLNDFFVDGFSQDLASLITESAVLRILVLSGSFYHPPLDQPIDIPARKRFPHGFDAAPLSLLHVFLGQAASANLRFAKSSSDAAIIHHINELMPSFLERADIAPLFAGVWVAEKIKKTAKFGGKLWNYPSMDAVNPVQFQFI